MTQEANQRRLTGLWRPGSNPTVGQEDSKFVSDLEMFKSVLASGQAVIKSATLINSGGAIAILAFVGHLTTDAQTRALVSGFATTLLWFVVGVFLASASNGLVYCASLATDISRRKWAIVGTASRSPQLRDRTSLFWSAAFVRT
jgi:hypothetical protein